MVLIRNNVTKESTYGWYPSQTNIYENPRAKHGYDKECLFRHYESGLHHTNPEGVSPVYPGGFRGSRSRSRTSKVSKSSTPQVPGLMISGSRCAKSRAEEYGAPPQFMFEKSRPSSMGHHIPTPKLSKGYHGWQPQSTIIGIVDPNGSFIPPSPKIDNYTADEDSYNIVSPKVDSNVRELTEAMLGTSPGPRAMTPAQHISGSYRVQSASLNRPRVSQARPVRSAGSRSHISQATSSVSLNAVGKSFSNITNNAQHDTHKHHAPSRTSCVQQADDEPEELERPAVPVNMRSPSPDVDDAANIYNTDYEDQIDKYGWIAEVQGDPLNLKKLTERLPYAFKCDDPVVGEYPYKTRVTLGDTFFLNTIPRKPASFTVHPEWQSENFVAKRQGLEKQGRKFHVRNFGFVY